VHCMDMPLMVDLVHTLHGYLTVGPGFDSISPALKSSRTRWLGLPGPASKNPTEADGATRPSPHFSSVLALDPLRSPQTTLAV
jgi:hypothetical protein